MPTKDTTILIVEDEWKIARFIQMELEHEGFKTVIETNGRQALDRIVQENFDLILLDIMLPEMSGIEVCRRVREISQIPIIMITAKGAIEDRVTGLDIGADDYLTKPFAIQELLARIRAALRKNKASKCQLDQGNLRVKNLVLFSKRFEAQVNGQPIELTKKEYGLLEYLVRNKHIVLDREHILQDVWGYEYAGNTNVVDVYIRYLRSKLDEQFGEKYIHTVRGIGYVVKD
ncbi:MULTISPECIES: response regulator transcription factor [Pelosinus]|uniref:Response regulator receiver n=1 Tax=Pelosinus fermentans B4 TaxID=1149862 RepID=I9ATW5_9FIRM|nr:MULTISPECIES: response regulator transcription factor [Pelosinus]EIW16382.1 response regulator receiver [Pelosinus fermentans B4]EIW22637.1 two component transcriptional regulator, winged helix family [Pelosinus fermentans A11]OAM95689.1 two component transcriptional regulator, winged helix family [Pelosinus fermentans DSM 17108]SDR31604.1 DNA-binding response regulator, OmpR family, contains REC and winged-helix (wHTH) domain [Pelosinus fermentans]